MKKSETIYIALLFCRSGSPKLFICGEDSNEVFDRARDRLQNMDSLACECFVAYDLKNRLSVYHNDIRDSLNET